MTAIASPWHDFNDHMAAVQGPQQAVNSTSRLTFKTYMSAAQASIYHPATRQMHHAPGMHCWGESERTRISRSYHASRCMVYGGTHGNALGRPCKHSHPFPVQLILANWEMGRTASCISFGVGQLHSLCCSHWKLRSKSKFGVWLINICTKVSGQDAGKGRCKSCWLLRRGVGCRHHEKDDIGWP